VKRNPEHPDGPRIGVSTQDRPSEASSATLNRALCPQQLTTTAASHPLCPTAASIKTALNGLADRLGKTGCTIMHDSPIGVEMHS